VPLEPSTLQRLSRRTDGRVVEGLGGTGIETLDGVVLLGEVPAVTGAENLMPLHRRLAVGGVVAAPDEGGTGTAIVTMIIGGYHHPEGIVIPRPPGVAVVEAVVGTAGEAEGGQKTQDLVAHPAGTPDTIERAIDTDGRTIREALCGMFNWGR